MGNSKQEAQLNKSFGDWLKSKRIEKGWTQQEAADHANPKLSLNTWYNLELGQRTRRNTIERAAVAVGADITEALEKAGFVPGEESARADEGTPPVPSGAEPPTQVDVADLVRRAKEVQSRGEYEEAEKLWRQAIAAEPGQQSHSRELMWMLYDQRETDPSKSQSIIQVYNDLQRAVEEILDTDISRLFRAVRHDAEDARGIFVGRGANVDQIVEKFDTWRLVTLWGREGIGKTELARAVMGELKRELKDGTCFVPLGTFVRTCQGLDDLTEQERVAQALLFSLKAPRLREQTLTEAVVAALETSTRLIVLDGCTSLRRGCAELVRTLLRNCPKIRILVTCRMEKGLELDKVDEELYNVPSLETEASVNSPLLPTALLLFQQRAAWANSGFKIGEDNKEAVTSICRKAQGLTTYIAWSASLLEDRELDQIAGRMPEPVPEEWWEWLTGPLNPDQRGLLKRLAVFPNGWTPEAAQQVCADESLKAWQIEAMLVALKALGLVHLEVTEARDSSHMETLDKDARSEMWEPLYESVHSGMRKADAESLKESLLDWCLTVAQKDGDIYHQIKNIEQHYNQFEVEIDNIRASLTWALVGPPETATKGLRLAGLTWGFWNVRGYWTEGRYWLKELLETTKSFPPSKKGLDALNGAGVLAIRQRDYQDAEKWLKEALACRYPGRTLDLEATVYNSLGYLYSSWASVKWEKLDEAEKAYEKAYDLYTSVEEESIKREMKWPLNGLGDIEMSRHRHGLSADHLKKSEDYFQRSYDVAQRYDDEDGVAQALRQLAFVSVERSEVDKAEGYFKQSLALLSKLENTADIINLLEQLADLAAGRAEKQQGQRAVRLYAAAQNLRQIYGVFNEAKEDYRRKVAEMRKKLGGLLSDKEYQELWQEGTQRSLQQSIGAALSS